MQSLIYKRAPLEIRARVAFSVVLDGFSVFITNTNMLYVVESRLSAAGRVDAQSFARAHRRKVISLHGTEIEYRNIRRILVSEESGGAHSAGSKTLLILSRRNCLLRLRITRSGGGGGGGGGGEGFALRLESLRQILTTSRAPLVEIFAHAG